MLLLPSTLAVKLLDGSLPWEYATQFHIDAFLAAYTLHDAVWITLHADCGREDTVVAAFAFDPVWNSSVSQPTSKVDDWPLLFLRFTSVSSIFLTRFGDIGGLPRGVFSVLTESLAEEEVVTTILDDHGASVRLQHFSLIHALVFSHAGQVIPLL